MRCARGRARGEGRQPTGNHQAAPEVQAAQRATKCVAIKYLRAGRRALTKTSAAAMRPNKLSFRRARSHSAHVPAQVRAGA
jgi:hypothetical protein